MTHHARLGSSSRTGSERTVGDLMALKGVLAGPAKACAASIGGDIAGSACASIRTGAGSRLAIRSLTNNDSRDPAISGSTFVRDELIWRATLSLVGQVGTSATALRRGEERKQRKPQCSAAPADLAAGTQQIAKPAASRLTETTHPSEKIAHYGTVRLT